MNEVREQAALDLSTWSRRAGIVGVVALVLAALGALVDLDQFFHSYLLAFVSWTGVAAGSLALWMIHNLTGGEWGEAIRPSLRAASRTIPLLFLLSIPLAFGLHHIYVWADPSASHESPFQADYLNVPFFLGRGCGYFVLWSALAWVLGRDEGPARALSSDGRSRVSGFGLVIYGLTVTFAAIDWIMSLDPTWSSTIFGALIATSQLLPALALAIAAAILLTGSLRKSIYCSPLPQPATDSPLPNENGWGRGDGGEGDTSNSDLGDSPGVIPTTRPLTPTPLPPPSDHRRDSVTASGGRGASIALTVAEPERLNISPDVLNDLGNLLLAMVMLWTYMTFSQFLLIWSGNLPEEITWYVNRSEGGWQYLAVVLALCYFGLPFLLLLLRDIKRKPPRLLAVALVLVGMSFAQYFWLVAPNFSPGQFYLHWLDILCLLGFGGIWLFWFLRILGGRVATPASHAQLEDALTHA